MQTLSPSPAPAPVAGTAPAPKAPRFYRATVATFRHPTASHVKGYVLIGSAWPRGSKYPAIYAERVYVLPMGDSFATHDGAEILGRLSDDVDAGFFALAPMHGAPVTDTQRETLARLGLDVPTGEEPAGSFSTAHLIAWSK